LGGGEARERIGQRAVAVACYSAPRVLSRAHEVVLPVREGERRLTLLLLLQNLFAVGAFVAGRSVRDALFLAQVDRGKLAWMYLASAGAVALVGAGYAPLAARVRRDRMALVSALVFAAGFGILWFAERRGVPAVYQILYVYVEVMGALIMVQFWTLANELFHAREARRLYGIIGAGGMMANVAIGLVTARTATGFGASAILLLCAALLGGCAVASFLAGRVGRQRLFARAASRHVPPLQRMAGGAGRVFASGHLRAVAALVALTCFTTSIVDFEFKVVAADALPKDQLAAFFGYLYAAVGVLAVGLQLFGTGRILARAGVIGALSILPLALGGGNVLFAIWPTISAAVLIKGSDTLFRYSVNQAATQILYLPVSPGGRASAKAFIDGVVKPGSIGVAGLVLLGYSAWFGGDASNLAWLACVLCGGWLLAVYGLRSRYVRSLRDNLRARARLDLESGPYRAGDGSANRVLVRALESGEPREVLNALELLPHLEDVDLEERIEPLLEHELPAIRIAALEYCKRRQSVRYANAIYRRFEDGHAGVRAAAIDAFCSIGKDKAVRSMRHYLKDPDPAVRSAAVTGLIRYGGLDGVLVAADALKELIAHADAAMRVHAARVLGAVGVSNFYQPVLELMNDAAPQVRREAIVAAGILRSPELVVPLIYRTRTPDTHRESVEALSRFGASIAGTLGKVLGNAHEPSAMRCAAAKVLGRIGTPQAVELVCRHLDESDQEVRSELYRALGRATKGKPFLPVDRKAVLAALDREFVRAYGLIRAAEVLHLDSGPGRYTPRVGPAAAAALLSSALSEEVAATEHRLFLLLGVLYPQAEMEPIYEGIRDPSRGDAPRRRANAVELLDNLLERDLKQKLLPLLEDARRPARLRAVEDELPLRRRTRDEVIAALCRDVTGWVRACAIHYACEHGATAAMAIVEEAVTDPDAVVREMALLGCARARPREVVAAIAEARLTDEAPAVRRQAALIAARRV
jgi:HEAT repeat protein